MRVASAVHRPAEYGDHTAMALVGGQSGGYFRPGRASKIMARWYPRTSHRRTLALKLIASMNPSCAGGIDDAIVAGATNARAKSNNGRFSSPCSTRHWT